MVEIEPIWVDWPYARIRRVLNTERGTITRFVVQLEYDVATASPGDPRPDWHVVAWFDHDSTSGGGHDVTEEGLHLDVYRDGERYARARSFQKIPPGPAMRYAENYFRRHADRLLARFELWHDLGPRRPD